MIAASSCVCADENLSDEFSGDPQDEGGSAGDEVIDVDVVVDEEGDGENNETDDAGATDGKDVKDGRFSADLTEHATAEPILALFMVTAILLPLGRHQ